MSTTNNVEWFQRLFNRICCRASVPYTSEIFYEEFNVEKVFEAKTFYKFHLQLFIMIAYVY